jgi:hypothetical protein
MRHGFVTEGIERCLDRTAEVSRGRSVRRAAHCSGGLKSLRRPNEGRCIQEAGVIPRWPEKGAGMEKPKRARRRKLDTAKVDLKPLLAGLRRTGCPL